MRLLIQFRRSSKLFHIGDLYVVGSGGYTIGEGANAEVCEAGDMIIATSTTPTWAAVQRNLVASLTEANLNGTTNGNKLRVYKDNVDNNLYVTQTDTDTWRAITVNANAFLGNGVDTGAINFAAGAGIELVTTVAGTIEIKNTSLLSSAKTLTFTYKPAENSENASDMFVYNPSAQSNSALEFDAGTNVSLLYESGVLTISSSYVDTLYKFIVNDTVNAQSSYVGGDNVDPIQNPLLILRSTGTDSTHIRFTGSGAATVTAKNDIIDIYALNTWRNVTAYKYNSANYSQASGEILSSSISTADLDFGEDFLWDATTSDNTSGQLHIGWAEVTSTVDGQGNVTGATVKYHI